MFFILTPLKAVCDVAVTWIITQVIDNALAGNLEALPGCAALFIAYLLADTLLGVALEHVRMNITRFAAVAMRSDVFGKLMRVGVKQFRSRSTASYLSTIETDVDTIRETYFFIIDSATELVTMLAALGVIFYYSWQIGAMLIVLTVLQAFIPELFDKKMDRAGEEYSASREPYMDRLQEGLSGYLTARIFHIEDRIVKRYKRSLDETEYKWKKREFTEAVVSSFSYVFNQIAYIGVFILGGYLMITGSMRLSVVVAITNLAHYISNPALYLVSDLAKLKIAAEPFRKIQDILDMDEDTGGKKELTAVPNRLSVRNLTCRYDDKTVLDALAYDFELGKKYLIVGQSGSGKSTLLSILAGINADYSGAVNLDDTELRELSRRSVAQAICYIDQEPFLFHDTVYQNVALYEDIDEATVTDALSRVGLAPRIGEMEQGIHTVLENNADCLSGGEKQRIAIARALVRQTPILLMDESTSHLDAQTAAEIEALLCGLSDITLLLVTHNATQTALQGADAVLEMKGGVLLA
ncbi:MAG: ABC transporter ATP-binding protein [Oscillospiraceae bacterium]|nr:ABC transporter ATP-binding protein [Oscillospiraceae bacterium]